MNLVQTITLLTLMTASFAGNNEVIYGRDGRVEVIKFPNVHLRALGDSVAARIKKESLSLNSISNLFEATNSLSMAKTYNICVDQTFAKQNALADCSGFLVAPGVLLTAKHCATDYSCENSYWVFDYKMNAGRQKTVTTFNRENVYECKSILLQGTDGMSEVENQDWALIELNRISNRPSIGISYIPVQPKNKVMAIGFPLGVPMKFHIDAEVLRKKIDNTKFLTNLDVFRGNSGGPVINMIDGKVAGIVIQGKVDSFIDPKSKLSCEKINICFNDGSNCKVNSDDQPAGEIIQKIPQEVIEFIKSRR